MGVRSSARNEGTSYVQGTSQCSASTWHRCTTLIAHTLTTHTSSLLSHPLPTCPPYSYVSSGNDLARALKWGGGYMGEKVMQLLLTLEDANITKLDRSAQATCYVCGVCTCLSGFHLGGTGGCPLETFLFPPPPPPPWKLYY